MVFFVVHLGTFRENSEKILYVFYRFVRAAIAEPNQATRAKQPE